MHMYELLSLVIIYYQNVRVHVHVRWSFSNSIVNSTGTNTKDYKYKLVGMPTNLLPFLAHPEQFYDVRMLKCSQDIRLMCNQSLPWEHIHVWFIHFSFEGWIVWYGLVVEVFDSHICISPYRLVNHTERTTTELTDMLISYTSDLVVSFTHRIWFND